jgi:glucose/arabinose dehydrogenase
LGGGVLYNENGVLLAIGTPTANSQIIDDLAQDYSTPYGKILFFDRTRMERRKDVPVGEYKIITSGHRNPQGLARIRGKIYEVEQGAKGGDEINIIKTGNNYGWPLFSLGSKYNGEIHFAVGPSKYAKPLFSFQPSIGLSNLTECPSNLQERYSGLTCILLSSLRGNSIFILLVDDNAERVISVEKIDLGMRIRDFFIPDQNSQIGQTVGITTDGYGAFNLTFNEIPITK